MREGRCVLYEDLRFFEWMVYPVAITIMTYALLAPDSSALRNRYKKHVAAAVA